ncbi:MAG: large conductance mechanosensitive channel protein MscL [Dehalococcoidia bacterium]|nr:large conductance mechanosensitive channel protein MscL [Dehalococcoidia bacterium]
MLKDFRDFIMRGNVLDMAVGIIIGAAFGTLVTSIVKDIIMPPIGLVLGNVDFTNLFAVLKAGTTPGPYASLADAQTAGAVTINYGLFINTLVSFLIVAVVLFFLIRAFVHARSRLETKKEVAPTTKECSYCLSQVPLKARKCAYCTSELAGQA